MIGALCLGYSLCNQGPVRVTGWRPRRRPPIGQACLRTKPQRGKSFHRQVRALVSCQWTNIAKAQLGRPPDRRLTKHPLRLFDTMRRMKYPVGWVAVAHKYLPHKLPRAKDGLGPQQPLANHLVPSGERVEPPEVGKTPDQGQPASSGHQTPHGGRDQPGEPGVGSPPRPHLRAAAHALSQIGRARAKAVIASDQPAGHADGPQVGKSDHGRNPELFGDGQHRG
ncbi:hypothetical protein ES703_118993 [subsurface metagenome]